MIKIIFTLNSPIKKKTNNTSQVDFSWLTTTNMHKFKVNNGERLSYNVLNKIKSNSKVAAYNECHVL